MRIKEFIKQLQDLNPESEIYIHECYEDYVPILQAVWDEQLQQNYFIITKGLA